MIILEDKSDAEYQIQGYEHNKIIINQIAYTRSVIIGPHLLITDWEPQSLEELVLPHLEKVIEQKPEIVLLGTGEHFKMPPSEIITFFHARHIGIECMNTGAICRTYTALISEGRNLIAAILIK
jgi:uncharacterized protein